MQIDVCNEQNHLHLDTLFFQGMQPLDSLKIDIGI
jgi:hypothetical protein